MRSYTHATDGVDEIMRVLWILAALLIGPIVGAAFGFATALAAMTLGPPRNDGTYGMREMLVCVPLGAVIGLVMGMYLAIRWTA